MRYSNLIPYCQIKSKLVQIIFIASLYVGIFLVIAPYFYHGFIFDFLPNIGIAVIIISTISYYFTKLSDKIDKNDSRLNELSNAGVDQIKIEGKSSFEFVFDQINNSNYLIELKIIADIETIYQNIFFIRDFIKNKKFDSGITIIISSSNLEEYKKQKSIIIEELIDITKQKTNKKIRIKLDEEFSTINSIIYDNNVWFTYNTKNELENSIFINVKSNSSFGRQIIDFYDIHHSKSNEVNLIQ